MKDTLTWHEGFKLKSFTIKSLTKKNKYYGYIYKSRNN